MLGALIAQVFRCDAGRVLAGLIRRFGDFDLAEDALQDACARALERWPVDGLPASPAAWLTTVAQRRALDQLRRRRTGALALDDVPDVAAPEPAGDVAGPPAVDDDRLRLLFTCCHPALAERAQVALALRTLCGLTTAEIARAFVESEATTAQRLVRVKRKITQARIAYVVPSREALPERLAAVLAVIYLVFNEGYASTDSAGLLRPDLCTEGIRLGRLLVDLLPGEPEAEGLLALMLLHDARRAARATPEGVLVPLEVQDRTRWNAAGIAEGISWLDQAMARHRRGPLQVQAAIAALHARAASPAATDWRQIAALYGALHRMQPTAIVALNAAVAVAMAGAGDAALEWIDRIEQEGELRAYHLLPAARADLLRRAGRIDAAAAAYAEALALVRNPAEKAYLARRLEELGGT